MPQAVIGGIDTHYEIDGKGTRTFLLFNGAGCTTRTWDELMPGLVKLGRTIRFDARGLGGTGPASAPYTLKTLADDGLALLDHLGITHPLVLAHAFGGRVAQVFTRDYPNRLQALILCGTGGYYPPLPLPQNPGPSAAIPSRVETYLATYFGSQFRARHPERAARLIAAYTADLQNARPVAPGERRQLLQMDPADSYWGKVPDSVPTLLLYGTEDKFGHEKNARDLALRLKRSKLVFIEGAGHMAIQEEPERLAAEIEEFLKENNL